MSFENPFNNPPPQETPEKKPEVKKEEEKEQPFSKEGLLNRNFGKDVEKPSEALFYKGGILNRPKFQEMAREQREQREREDAEKIAKLRGELGIAAESQPAESGEQPFSPEGLLNRNFGKNKEQAPSESETVPAQESIPSASAAESGSVENTGEKEKPLMQQMVESYQKLSNDPEKSAYDALYNRLEPNLPEEEKQKQMARMTQEYRLFKKGKDWKQNL
jgi:polyhydroxyalkanoate synthesis regulator phasin